MKQVGLPTLAVDASISSTSPGPSISTTTGRDADELMLKGLRMCFMPQHLLAFGEWFTPAR